MSAAANIGRIGALAVALGVGAAVTLGTGTASAAPNEGGKGATGSAAQSNADTGNTAAAPGTSTTAPESSSPTNSPGSSLSDRVRKRMDGLANSGVRPTTDLTTPRTRPITSATKDDSVSPAPTKTPPVVSGIEDAGSDEAVTKNPPRRNSTVEVSSTGSESVSNVREIASMDSSETEKSVVSTVDDTTDPVQPVIDRSIASVARTEVMSTKSASAPVESAQGASVAPASAGGVISSLATSLFSVANLTSLTGNGPALPADPLELIGLLAWVRREFGRAINPSAGLLSVANLNPVGALIIDPNGLTPQPVTPTPGATTTPPAPGQTLRPNWVTGGTVTNALPPGTPGAYGIAGTDLGIMWDDGAGNVLMLFGDTFDQPGMQGVWRNNVLLRSVDTDLSDGLQIQDAVISPGGDYSQNTWSNQFGATQVIRDPGFLGLFGSTTTIIPTAAISVTDEAGNTTQYANVMSVRSWDTPGRWTTNWSAIAYSTDGGKSWVVDENTVRSSGWLRSSASYVPGNQNFQQGAFVQGPDTDVDPNGVRYVYSFGTPSGRGGSAYVARVPETQIRDLSAYEYWAGEQSGWVADDPSVAVPVIGATGQSQPTGFIGFFTKIVNDFLGGIVVGGLTGGNVSEMSVQYNPYLQKYVVLYTDGGNNVVMRVSDSPQGTWSEASTLLVNNPATSNTAMYAPMIHPWSGTDKFGAANEQYLYWNLSYFGPYNVQLKQTDLSPLKAQYTTRTTTV